MHLLLRHLRAAQLSDRYPQKQWEEIVSACDWQLFLGCNDLMTAEYISKRCGTVTVRTDSNQMPQMPLFSPVYNSTKPYSITRSATQRLLMMPDEIMQLDNKGCLVLIRGRRPLRLRKIIVEEMPEYGELKPCRVTEHFPVWRDVEAEGQRKKTERETVAGERPARRTKNTSRVSVGCDGQQTVAGWNRAMEPEQDETMRYTPAEKPADSPPKHLEPQPEPVLDKEKKAGRQWNYVCGFLYTRTFAGYSAEYGTQRQ